MTLKEYLLKEIVRNGYFEKQDKTKVWDIANRSFLYMTPELVNSFLKLRNHPRYKKTVIDIENSLLKQYSKKFMENLETPFNLIDMGCGDGTKIKVFLETLQKKGKIRFMPVNISEQLVNLTLENIKKENFKNVEDYKPYIACLDELNKVMDKTKDKKYEKNVILLLGSILASFDIHSYLFNLSQAMSKGDRLIIGNAIRTGQRFENIDNYKHEIFQEWLINIIKELGFGSNEVEYGARFANSRVEIFYKIKTNKQIHHNGKKIDIKQGDEIVVAILYKYYERELEEFCKMYFREVELVKDPENEYALILCKK